MDQTTTYLILLFAAIAGLALWFARARRQDTPYQSRQILNQSELKLYSVLDRWRRVRILAELPCVPISIVRTILVRLRGAGDRRREGGQREDLSYRSVVRLLFCESDALISYNPVQGRVPPWWARYDV